MAQLIDYDAKLFHLGSLCKRGHAWPGTAQSLRRSCQRGGCVECEKIRLYAGKTSGTKYRRERKREIRQQLRDQGLTAKGTVPTRTDGGVQKGEKNELILLSNALRNALRNAGQSPSVARLVMDEQLRHWRENPEEKRRHNKEWAQISWWLKYQINPELRLYHREKSKRRKAQDRGQTPVQIPVAALRQRFNEFGNCCAYCGDGGDMQIEHVEPISKGGAHDIGNIVPACCRCNTNKRNHEMEEWYRSQPFFGKLRLHRIRRVMRQPEAYQLAMM